ncbi:MAG: nickel pincer cofactor biosynthesis protein LarC [Propionibacteriaceae bacterium]|jgi:uncharacterized protein (TIGR00299 family) protein|nr:nickel pincer cofactor biosynthesis protein LarC [Propionibacteriaceae bacterium]
MTILYLECAMGAAGDMLMAALLELVDDRDDCLAQLNGLGLERVRIQARPGRRGAIGGTVVDVWVDDLMETVHHHGRAETGQDHVHQHLDHDHTSLAEVLARLDDLPLSDRVQGDARAVYSLIAQAEAKVHGRPAGQVHFHEVGHLDALADVVGVCLLLERLDPDQIVVSPIHLGRGFVTCAHGVLPVPAPATAELLRGLPTWAGPVEGELCTPTGAALLKHFATGCGPQPTMTVDRIGYGLGHKDFDRPNCLRAFWGEAAGQAGQLVAELRCNLDDMTGEALAYACDQLRRAGALEVFLTPVLMKKGRPGHLLTCLCDLDQADQMTDLMLRHTTTFGVRRSDCPRTVLQRQTSLQSTVYGDIRVKTGHAPGLVKAKAEHDDLAQAAERAGLPLSQIAAAVALPTGPED